MERPAALTLYRTSTSYALALASSWWLGHRIWDKDVFPRQNLAGCWDPIPVNKVEGRAADMWGCP